MFALSKLTTWHRETQKYQKSDPLRCQLIIVAYSGHATLMQQVLSRFEGGWVQLHKSLPSAHRTKSARWQRPEAPDQLTHVNNFADWLCSSLPSILIKNELDISFVYLCLNLYLCICVFDCVCCMCICARIHVCTLKTQSQRSTKKLSTSKLPVSYRALSLRTSKDKIKIKARPRD